MKQKILLAIFAAILFMQHLHSQGFIYAHLKHINEESSPNYFFTLTNSSGVTVDTFSLNDAATANGVALSGVNLNVYDLGLSHGTGGDGQLWSVAGSGWNMLVTSTTLTGTIYYRNAGSSKWLPAQIGGVGITNARFIDGAYANQFVYSTTTGVYFYNNGSITTLLSGGTNVGDVTCNNGRVAAVINGVISVYSNSYTATSAPSTTGGSWSTGVNTGNTTATRIDMNISATAIAYEVYGSNAVSTTGLTGTATTSLGNVGDSKSGYTDVAYDDLGTLYATAYSNTYGSDQIFHNTSGTGTTWVVEASSRDQEEITGGAAHLVYSVNNQGGNSVESIFSRQTDNLGNTYWIDDERVRNSSSLMGNGVVIPVAAGTYTLTETLPSSSYDLGRYNIYDPAGGGSTSNVNTQVITFKVSANEVVFGEYINEALNPKVIASTCTTQYLQTFDASTSSPILTYTYGNGTYGTQLEGTAYHYFNGGSPNDGYYYLTKTATGSNWFQAPGLSDHTGNGGYFLLLNASYAKDEFYRQRVTGLVPGLSYTISFWGANASPTATILPNITYGLQDSLGNVVNSATTSNIAGALNANDWLYFSFTFTATTSRADLFISNNAIGGNGNDLAIDDISLNPVLVPLPGITVSPTIAPNICIGTNYIFSNTQTGGGWTSSNTSAATINYNSGRAKGLTTGSSVITYTYTNAIGCVTTQSTSIIVSAPPTVTATDMLGGTSCLGQIDSLYSTASGTATPFTYLWSDPSGTGGLTSTSTLNTSVNPTVSGNYTFVIKVTDAVGCAGTASVALAVSSHTAPTVTTTGSNVCLGSAITNLKASSTGGSGIYTYAWTATPSSTSGLNLINSILQSPSPTPTAAGSYSYGVTVSDGYCNIPVKQAVTVYPAAAVSATSSPNGIITICTNGVIDLTATSSGGTAPYGFVWSATPTGNGLVSTTTQNTTAKPTGSGTYIYSVKLTDANGCTASSSVTDIVTVNPAFSAPVITASAGSSALCANASVALNGSLTGGTSPYSYVWSGPATIVSASSGSTTATSYNTTATPGSSGNYTLTVTDTKGCIGAASTGTVAVNARPTVTASSYASALCTNTKDTVYATASGIGTLSYAWSVSAPTGGSVTYSPGAAKATTGVALNTTTGNYIFTVTVTDAANSCTNTASTTIANTSNTGPAITNMNAAAISCVGSAITLSPTVTAGSSGGLTTTKLTPTATGGLGLPSCSTLAYANAFDGNTSTIFADNNQPGGGSAPYSGYVYADLGAAYQITQLTFNPITGQEAAMNGGVFYGTNTNPSSNYVGATVLYTIASTPATGLNTVTSIASTTAFRYIVYQGPASSVNYNVGGTCSYSNTYFSLVADISIYTGSTSSTPIGIASYLWTATPIGNGLGATNTQSTTATPTATGSYTYTIKVTDNTGCVASASTATQTVNSAVTVSAQAITAAFCGTGATDQFYAIASGGSGTYSTYTWTVAGTAGPGSSALSSYTIYNPVASITSATTASSFIYAVTVKDNNGCTGTARTNTIAVASAPTVSSVTGSTASTCANSTNTITLAATFSGGTSAYNYFWTPPSNSTMYTTNGIVTSAGTIKDTATATVAQNYSYGFTVEDANNCTASGTMASVIAVNQGLSIAANVSTTGPVCANPATSINLTSTVTGGTGAITYLWSGPTTITSASSQNTTATPTATGAYTMTANDTKGCTGSFTTQLVTVDQAPPSISITCGTNSSGINYANFYESNGTTWLWATTSGGRFYTSSALSVNSDGTTSNLQSPFVTYNGTYTVQITDGNNCIGSGSYILTSTSCSNVLAISGLNFVAVKQNNEALLTWSTLTEVSNAYFNIERSSDGINWQVIGTVQAKGNSSTLTNYSFIDALPIAGTNYYRLKQVDDDGVYGYSPVRTLQFTGQWLVKLYPNPVQNFIVLEFNNDRDEKGAITIQSVSGSTVFTAEQQLTTGLNRITLNQIQFMAQGTYVLTLGTSENVYRAKFVKGGN